MQTMTVSDTGVRVVRRGKRSQATERKVFSTNNGGLPESEYRSLAEKVAQHRLYKRGVFMQVLQDKFPRDKHMWIVSRCFPYSVGGPLFIDEPRLECEVADSMRKKAVLEGLGHRCIVIGPKTTYQEAMEQMSEYPCPGSRP